MKSKYSGIEIEKKLDSIDYKLNKYDIINSVPTTLKDDFKDENLFSSNVIVSILQKIKDFKLQSPTSFLKFVENIPGFNLLSDAQAEKLLHLSANFVGVFSTINDVPNLFKNGSLALVQSGPFGHPEYIFRSKKRWFYLNGSKIKHAATKGDELTVGHNVMKPYNMAKVTLYAINDDNTHTIEFNVIKSKNHWWIQIFKNTLLEDDKSLVEISLNRTPTLDPYPEIIIESLSDCDISMNLEIVL